MEKFIVPRLDHFAFKVSFKEILSNLVLCQDHRPNEKQMETVSYSSFLSIIQSLLTSENLINFVRKRLDYFLVGLMNDEIRKKYLQMFYESFFHLNENNIIDPWVFLECVLDDTIQELDTHAAFPDAEPNLLLIPTIVKRSNQLRKLKIDFSSIKKNTMVDKISPIITSLCSLQQLTNLNLYEMEKSHRSVLKSIGDACPLLTHLSISGFPILQSDIFSLILGQFGDVLFPENGDPKIVWSDDSSIQFLQAPSEIIAPFCFSLRRLQLENFDRNISTKSRRSVTTFALRHLPLLEKMDGHSTSFGVENLDGTLLGLNEEDKKATENIDSLIEPLLDTPRSPLLEFVYENWDNIWNDEVRRRRNIAKRFEDACKELVGHRLCCVENSHLFNRPTFSGSLSLISLDFVYPSPALLRTIPKFCPHLKEVVFWTTLFAVREHGRPVQSVSSPDEFQELLQAWPKLETITFMDILPEHVRVILKAFASSLKQVTFKSCQNINLMDLMPCTQLEGLCILESSSLEETKAEPDGLSPSSFLPHLKSFESNICLGLWSLWLEGKHELTRIILEWCHIGTKGSIHSDWTSLTKMWPNLEIFNVQQSTKLTIPIVANIVPQFGKLKELSLPEKIVNSELEFTAKTWEELKYRSAPIDLRFTKDRFVKVCSYLLKLEEDSMNSDDEMEW